MKIFTPKDFPLPFETVITIGSFDGIHLGHQALIKETKKLAKELRLTPVVVTFEPHPRRILFPDSNFKLLTTLEEKIELISQTGIEHMVLIPFTKELAQWSPDLFVQEYIVDGLHAKGVVVGFNFGFGKNRKGNIDTLKHLGKKYNFLVNSVGPVIIDGIIVSSSSIRNFLEKKEIETANKLLGRNYFFSGRVIEGKKRGEKLGFPTANLEIPPYKLIPPPGVYAVWVHYKNQLFKGAMNIGKKPTFEDRELSIEVHIFDFNKDIYDEILKIEVIRYIRNEIKFPSIEALKNQIQLDCQFIRQLLT
ncbi:MAG: riboflavin biosynthesis protein RibF [Thermodesulfobacteriota bacterium]|nr:MAG: riboflavin biosynthesis protein RibF [Thermodesulfobacteriota bacterium]